MNQKEAREAREKAYGMLMEDFAFCDFQVYGRIQEGVVLSDGDNYAVAKVIMKKQGFEEEVDALIEEYQAKQQAKAEKAKEKEEE